MSSHSSTELDVPSPPLPATAPRRRRLGPLLPLAAVVVVAVTGVAIWAPWATAEPAWATSEARVADVTRTVSSTGNLQARETVDVGTQVSGVIQELLVDYNDEVVAGQVIARIDPTLLEADVSAARATLSLRQAEVAQARSDRERARTLAERDAATAQELETAELAFRSASAQLELARVALERAERNLGYATITSPITGIVVEKDVEVGQTVNAGTTAPRLVAVAGDLARMEIVASVDESDIGLVEEGQPVKFTVQAWPDESFAGVVEQVRLQSTVTDNVVTYAVVVDVENPERRLLPGMTATVDFVVASVEGGVVVPNAALRFQPEGAPQQRGAGVWTVEGGTLVRIPVEVGITDGRVTAVSGLEAGRQVVTGVSTAQASTAKNPFQQQPSSGSRGRAGGF